MGAMTFEEKANQLRSLEGRLVSCNQTINKLTEEIRRRRSSGGLLNIDPDVANLEEELQQKRNEKRELEHQVKGIERAFGNWAIFKLRSSGSSLPKPTPTKMTKTGGTKKRVWRKGLKSAADYVRKQVEKSPGKRTQINACKEFLQKHKIPERPGYTPQELSNYVSQMKKGG